MTNLRKKFSEVLILSVYDRHDSKNQLVCACYYQSFMSNKYIKHESEYNKYAMVKCINFRIKKAGHK